MKNIKFIEKNNSNIHKIKNMKNVIREPRECYSHHQPYIAKPETQKDYNSCKGQ